MTDLDLFGDLDTGALPERQQRILVVIRDWVTRYGYPPSSRQIGDAVGLRSSSSVSKHLASLEDKGFLRRSPSVSRPIDVRMFLQESTVRDSSEDSVPVPVVGDVAAGTPIAAIEQREPHVAPVHVLGDLDAPFLHDEHLAPVLPLDDDGLAVLERFHLVEPAAVHA